MKIFFFFSKSPFSSFISFSRIIFLELSDFILFWSISFSVLKASTWTFKFYSSFLLLSASVELLWVAAKELFFVWGVWTWVNPLIWETLTPLEANLSSSYFTLYFSFSIFCCLPFHPFSSERAWSMSKF